MLHDLNLARRLEAAHARDGEVSAEAHARLNPEGGSSYERIAGGSMIFCGVGSFLTHALGLGVNTSVSDEDLDRLETFYFERGSPAEIDLCPFSDPTLAGRLFERSYRPDHFEQALVREVIPEDGSAVAETVEDISIEPATPDLVIPYCDLLTRGFDLPPEYGGALVQAGRITFASEGVRIYAALSGARLIAAGSMRMEDGVVGLSGATTLPEFRRRGLQTALLTLRLRDAAREGCDLAAVNAMVGTTSQRNIERAGFHPAYTRTVLVKPCQGC